MMTRRMARVIQTAALLCVVTLALPAGVQAQEVVGQSKVAGLPVGIIKQAFTHSNATRRQKLFALVKQRISRDPVARQRFLDVDTAAAAARLARFQYSAQMLSEARNETSDTALQAKLDDLIAAIGAAGSSSQ